MFGKKKGVNKSIASLIGQGTHVEGNVFFQGGLRVDGHIKGNIYSDAAQPSILVISEHGRVDGEIHASHLVVSGLINGPVSVTELLELQPKARINGNVLYRALEMHKGAIVRGVLTDESEEGRPLLKLASNQN